MIEINVIKWDQLDEEAKNKFDLEYLSIVKSNGSCSRFPSGNYEGKFVTHVFSKGQHEIGPYLVINTCDTMIRDLVDPKPKMFLVKYD